MSYLRNRPFMVVSYSFVPKEGQNTRAKDFALHGEYDPIENMVIVDRISDKMMQTAEVILDLFESKVIKCRDGSLDPKQVFDKLVARHFDEVKAALATWIAKDANNLQKVQAFVDSQTGGSKSEDETNGDA